MEEKSGIAKVLSVFGFVIIVLGIISGLYYGASDSFEALGDLQGAVAWGVVLQGLIIGFLFIGISEIIFKLNVIADNKNKVVQNSSIPTNISVNDKISTNNQGQSKTKANRYHETLNNKDVIPLSEGVLDGIETFYSKQGTIVQYIKGTKVKDVYHVKTINGIEIVEYKPGYSPVVLKNDKVDGL